MTTEIIGLLAETYIHPGTGQSAGAIDLPVARERVTQYPFIPGSSMKGALLDASRGSGLDTDRLFGQQENAGQLLISDARLLLLPVRSLTSPYIWLTCPHLIERFRRDMERAGKGAALPKVAPLADGKALAAGAGDLFLEERLFAVESKPPEELAAAIGALIPHDDAVLVPPGDALRHVDRGDRLRHGRVGAGTRPAAVPARNRSTISSRAGQRKARRISQRRSCASQPSTNAGASGPTIAPPLSASSTKRSTRVC
jgi:RAMP superfamily protein